MSMYAIVGKQTGSLPSAARQPTRRRNTPRRAYYPNTTLRVYAGKKHDAKNRQRGSKKPADKKKHDGWKMNSMATVKSDETMLFQPVPGNADALTVIYAYPNEYSVGITSLGYQLVYAFLEMSSLVNVTRMFTDVGDPMPRNDVDLVGFSFSWELDYSNLIDMLEGLDIPILAADRTDKHPIVFGGGPALTANPEPFAAFFDVVLLGDGEEMLSSFIRTVHDVTRDGVVGTSRRQRERSCPHWQHVLAYVEKQTYRGGTLASSTIVSPRMAWENIFMAEVVRSCPEMCRFCLASYLTLPFRAAPLEGSLIPTIEKGLQYTDRIGLLGASVTQHPEFSALLEWLMQPERSHVRLSIASVRTNTVTEELATALSSRGTRSLTIAVESGSSKVRRIVNKKLEQEDIEKAAVNAQAGGLQALKLYGMAGVPGETEHDIDETIQMMTSLKKAAPKLKLTLGCSTFVPKAHTPFQWRGVDPAADKRLKRMDKELKKHGIQFRPESYKWSVVQALLSRGDRRMTEMLLRAKSLGDSLSTFKRAAKEVPDMPLCHTMLMISMTMTVSSLGSIYMAHCRLIRYESTIERQRKRLYHHRRPSDERNSRIHRRGLVHCSLHLF
eukprot:jgi/Picre1/32620/NNA_007966.t1